MPFIEWNEGVSVGIKSIDDEHLCLMTMLNAFYEGIQNKKSRDDIMKAFEAFITCSEEHFKNEEGYFLQTGYMDGPVHKEEHDVLLRELKSVFRQYADDKDSIPSNDLAEYLRDWFVDHVLESDMKYTQHLIASGIR